MSMRNAKSSLYLFLSDIYPSTIIRLNFLEIEIKTNPTLAKCQMRTISKFKSGNCSLATSILIGRMAKRDSMRLLRILACVLFGLSRAAPNCTQAVKGVCFVKHDENIIFKADSEAACCAACDARSTCKVYMYLANYSLE